jgi:hypothetical protein
VNENLSTLLFVHEDIRYLCMVCTYICVSGWVFGLRAKWNYSIEGGIVRGDGIASFRPRLASTIGGDSRHIGMSSPVFGGRPLNVAK